MNDMQKRYTVIELADIIGVPRTTINDWLGKYAQYIESQTQGKRRIYTDASVSVLKEIAELRNSGLSSFEIENELSRKHPVMGEPAQMHPGDRQENVSEEKSSPETKPQENIKEQVTEEFAMIAKKQSDEIGQIIGESFRTMAQKMEELEKNSRRDAARAKFSYGLIFALLGAMIIVGLFAAYKMNTLSNAGSSLEKDIKAKNTKIDELSEKTISLISGTESMKKNIEILESGMSDQKAKFEKNLEELKKAYENSKKDLEAMKNAELMVEKEKFAAERLSFMRDIERMARDSEAVNAELKRKNEEMLEKLKKTEAEKLSQAGK